MLMGKVMGDYKSPGFIGRTFFYGGFQIRRDGKAGINASLMRQYSMGIHQPSKKRKQQILECLHQIAKELQTAVI